MVRQWACTLELICVILDKALNNSLRVLGTDGQIINISCYVFVNIANLLHPNITISFRWCKTHVSKCVRKMFMPS